MENTTFNYTYSAERNKEVESIRKKYLPREKGKLEMLKELDCRVQTAGVTEALCLGTVGALVFGVGICFFLGVFTGTAWLAALLMALGAVIMLPAYPIYRRIACKAKEELAPEILRLSEEIINPQKNQD